MYILYSYVRVYETCLVLFSLAVVFPVHIVLFSALQPMYGGRKTRTFRDEEEKNYFYFLLSNDENTSCWCNKWYCHCLTSTSSISL